MRLKSTIIISIFLSIVLALSGIFTHFYVYANSKNKEHVHEFGEWEVSQEVSCLEDGLKTRLCSCGETEEEIIHATGHNFSSWAIKQNESCLQDRIYERKCSNCGLVETKTTHSHDLGHVVSSDWTIVKEPTLSEDGLKVRKCSCGLSAESLSISKLTKKYIGVWYRVFDNYATAFILSENSVKVADCLVDNTAISIIEYVLDVTIDEIVEDGKVFYPVITFEGEQFDNYVKYFYDSDKLFVFDEEENDYLEYYRGSSYSNHEHNYVLSSQIDSTCLNEGTKIFECICGDTITESIPCVAHTFVDEVVSSTCVDIGYINHMCSVCGYQYTSDEISSLGHDYIEEVISPTCLENGYTIYTCSRCGDTYNDNYISELGHDYGEWVVDSESTCLETGLKHKTCLRCDYVVTEEIKALGHDYNLTIHEPICDECGYTTYTCSRCGDFYNDDIVQALGHNYISEITSPTCLDNGYTTYTCSVCGISYIDDNTLALGHDYGEWVIDVEPTCLESGSKHKTCLRCGDIVTEEVSALGHDYVGVVTLPTCLDGGYTTYTCSHCRDSYVDDYISAIGHDYGEWVIDVEPTCLESGSKHKTCSRCGDIVTEEISALGHDYGEWVIDVEPICLENGSKHKSCSRCGDIVTEEIPAFRHDYNSTIHEPTCLEGGYTTHTCSRCEDVYVDCEIEALGHDYEMTITATCTESGSRVYTCKRCGYSYSDLVSIEALGHDYGEWVIDVEPTDSESGERHKTCLRCGDVVTESISPLNVNIVSPTIMSINNTSESDVNTTLNIYKENTDETTIKLNGSTIACSTLNGTQDISVTLPVGECEISIEGGEWYFDSLCLGSIANNSYLTEIKLGDSYGTIIGANAFRSSSLISISIPENVISIKDYAINMCKNLTSITLGTGVISIGRDAFFSSVNLVNVYYEGKISDWCNIEFTNVKSTPLYYANHFYLKDSSNEWNEFTEISIENTTSIIKSYAFYNFSILTSIIIPDSVTSIGDEAFYNCSALTCITIPSSVTSIGIYVFSKCSNLDRFVASGSYTTIDNGNLLMNGNKIVAFAPYGITTYSIPDTVSSIETGAFSYCSCLVSVTILSNVTDIGSSAFCGCTDLTSVNLYATSSLTKIQTYMYGFFYSCSTSLTIHVSSSLNASTSITAFGKYWNNIDSTFKATTLYDL